jgi:23S rRNA (uracil1939-C5)-methyltransferase
MNRDDQKPNLTRPIAITALGAQGDGIATVDGIRVFVPFALPGEQVEAELVDKRGDGWTARLLQVVTPSPQRVAAPCPHFGRCGGCMLQQWQSEAYRAWKLGLVETALKQRGLALPEGATLVATPPATRRRARFSAERTREGMQFGFHAPESEDIVDLADCRVLTPSLLAQVPLLRNLAEAALGVTQRAVVTASETETGLDVLISAEFKLERRRALTEAGSAAPIARLCWQQGRGEPEPLVQHRPPRVSFAGIGIDLPADAFLQPSAAGEAALVEAVTRLVGKSKAMTDLYAGCGTFTFPLAKLGKVAAVEQSKPAMAAVMAAVNRSGLSGRVTALARNLDASPLSPEELKPFDCAVFDPPRAGAKAQAEMLVRSRLKRVVAVSCNPASFARDARILVDGGFALKELVAVDQFVWSPHVEVVALFRRSAVNSAIG